MRRALDWLVVDGHGHAIPIVSIIPIVPCHIDSALSATVDAASGRQSRGLETDQVLERETNADPFADGVVVVRRHQ